MIGPSYWCTGIHVKPQHDGKWGLHLDFLDDGFYQERSTEGRLRIRYVTQDLSSALDTLIEDAKRLGIEFRCGYNPVPFLYVPGDGEDPEPWWPTDWKAIIQAEAKRIGWRTYGYCPPTIETLALPQPAVEAQANLRGGG